MKNQILILLFKYGLGLGLLAWVVWSYWSISHEGQEVGIKAALEKPIHVVPLVLAGLICLASVLLTFVRWYILVRAQGLPFTLTGALRLGMIGYYLNTFLPGSVGGDIIKAAFIAREQSRRTVAVATVVLDRAVGLCGLFWLAALLGGVFWFTGQLEILASPKAVPLLEFIVLGAMGVVAGNIAFWLILGVIPADRAERLAGWLAGFRWVGHSLAEFWRAVWLYRRRGRSIALALAMSMAGHGGFIVAFYCSARTLQSASEVPSQVPSLGAHFLLVPVGATIQAGFPAPGGVGGGEFAFGILYQFLGSEFAAGVLASLVYRILSWTWGLVGYLVYLRMRPSLRQVGETNRGVPDRSL